MSYDVSKRPADYATRRAGAHERDLLLLIGLVFWISSLHDRPDFGKKAQRNQTS